MIRRRFAPWFAHSSGNTRKSVAVPVLHSAERVCMSRGNSRLEDPDTGLGTPRRRHYVMWRERVGQAEASASLFDSSNPGVIWRSIRGCGWRTRESRGSGMVIHAGAARGVGSGLLDWFGIGVVGTLSCDVLSVVGSVNVRSERTRRSRMALVMVASPRWRPNRRAGRYGCAYGARWGPPTSTSRS